MSSSASDSLFPAAVVSTHPRANADSCLSPARVEDDDLMAAIQAGNERALAELLDRHASLVLGIGYRILRDSGEAHELVQDVFLHTYRKCQLFDPRKGTVRSWLARITCRRALDRRKYLTLHGFYDDRNLNDFMDVLDAAIDLEHKAELGRYGQALKKAFQELSVRERVTLELYFFEGYTLREISERFNESLGNTRHHYHRALERLRTSVYVSSLRDQPHDQ